MIDLRAARNDPEAFRAALRRRGADNAFDELLAADGRWRALVPQVDELRARQKIDGKPTPEQIEELKGVKDRLRALEEELASAEAEREAALAKVPNPPHESAADGMTEDEAVEIKRWGEPPQLEHPREHTELGRFELERAAKISGARFGFIAGDTALLALALYRHALDRLVQDLLEVHADQRHLGGADEIEPVLRDRVAVVLLRGKEARAVHRLLPHKHGRQHGREAGAGEAV